jgi:hypothetical protein
VLRAKNRAQCSLFSAAVRVERGFPASIPAGRIADFHPHEPTGCRRPNDGKGHEDQFKAPSPNVGCWLGQGTLAGATCNGQDAPIAAIGMPESQRVSEPKGGLCRSACRQQNLSDMRARFHQPVRLGGLGEREDSVDHRLHGAGLEQRPHLVAQRAADRRLVRD